MTQWEVDEYDEKVLCIDDINGVKCKYIRRVVRNALRHMKVTWKEACINDIVL